MLAFTVARYFSPQDREIDGQGIQPDVVATDGDVVRVALAKLRSAS